MAEVLFVGRTQRRDLNAALQGFARAWDGGMHDACFFFAWCLERGHGDDKKEPDAARELYVDGAERGIPLAQAWCALNGVLEYSEFESSEVVAIYSDERASDTMVQWLFRPFLLGEAHALGLCGLAPDVRAAEACYRVAAQRGLIDAERALLALAGSSSASSESAAMTMSSSSSSS